MKILGYDPCGDGNILDTLYFVMGKGLTCNCCIATRYLIAGAITGAVIGLAL